jgi:serine O-acetyltransferase
MLAVDLCTQSGTMLGDSASTQRKRDPLWSAIQAEALDAAERDPVMRPMLDRLILDHRTIGCALVHRLAELLTEPGDDPVLQRRVFAEVVATSRDIRQAIKDDLLVIRQRDPATTSNLTPFLNFKGFQALQASRIAHALWHSERKPLAMYLQGRISAVFGIDIHPAARIGRGVFIDHATGVVIGETATVGNNVVILHDVTLGATGKDRGDRHPKVDDDVFIGAGAKILGNIPVGKGATVGAGSIVLREVPPGATVAGIPARVVRHAAVNRITQIES